MIVVLNDPVAVVFTVASTAPIFEAVSTPICTVNTAVGFAALPCAEQPEKFCPDTVTALPGFAVNGLTENTGTLHDADGLGVAADAAAIGTATAKTAIPLAPAKRRANVDTLLI